MLAMKNVYCATNSVVIKLSYGLKKIVFSLYAVCENADTVITVLKGTVLS
jgi:hypothetical protein